MIVIGIVLSAIDTDPLGGGMLAATAVNRKALSIGLASAVLFAISLVAASRTRHARRAVDDRHRPDRGRAAHQHPGPGARAVPAAGRRLGMLGINCAGDLAGFSLFILATEDGVAVPAVLASQYATLTAVFGYFVFHERLKPWQWAGVALTIAGTARRGCDYRLSDAAELLGRLDRDDEAGGRRDALAGDVERGAVVDAGADDRQAERDVDALVEAEVLDRDQALVVVLRDDDVEARPRAPA